MRSLSNKKQIKILPIRGDEMGYYLTKTDSVMKKPDEVGLESKDK